MTQVTTVEPMGVTPISPQEFFHKTILKNIEDTCKSVEKTLNGMHINASSDAYVSMFMALYHDARNTYNDRVYDETGVRQ